MVINLGSVESRRARITATLFILLGAGALNLAVVESANGRMNGVVAGILIVAAVALIVVMIPVFWTAWRLSARQLIIEPAGIRWHDPKGRSWTLPWHELAAVSISLHAQTETPDSMVGMCAGAAVDSLGKAVRAGLVLLPADPGVRSRHPEMERLWEIHSGAYRQPFSGRADAIRQIEWGMSHLQPRRYRGVQRTPGGPEHG